jgi:hypothetical protein
VDAVGALGGRAIVCLRISFSDARSRHEGVSHHSLTSLGLVARPATVVVPELPTGQGDVIAEQLRALDPSVEHQLVTAAGNAGVDLLVERGIGVDTMGRSLSAAPEPFLAAAAAGAVGAGMVTDRRGKWGSP